MILYIHFGIYKAGSSFIQYICANKRSGLAENGIYFPEAKPRQEKKMIAGFISKGNAEDLNYFLNAKDTTGLNKVLEHLMFKAKKAKASSVLISAEALVFHLANIDRLNLLLDVVHNVGFKKIMAMAFFRDLADHALSTYKHRANTGKIPDYELWIKEAYETPQLLENLSQTIESSKDKINWTLRKFQKNSEFLKQAFFEDWLGLKVPDFKTKSNVNQSVTISEIKVLNHLKDLYPSVPSALEFFMRDLKNIPKIEKADDKELENFVYNKFCNVLLVYTNILNRLNTFFSEEEHLIVCDNIKDVESKKEPYIKLSDKQLATISHRILFFNSFVGKMILSRRRLLNLIRYKNIKHLV